MKCVKNGCASSRCLLFFTPSLSTTICNESCVSLATFKHDGVLILSWMTPPHREMPSENLHASQGPHFCVDEGSLNLLPTDVWLSNSLCTHVTLCALSLCPFEQHCCFLTFDQMGVQMETLLGSSRRYVPEGLPGGMGAGRRRPELHSRHREQEQPQVHARLPELQHRKPTNN